jgi:hypothetical protein
LPQVRVTGGTMASLTATPLARTTLREFYSSHDASVARRSATAAAV